VPIGVVALVLVMVAMPSGFPYGEKHSPQRQSSLGDSMRKVDFPGFVTFLAACLLLVVALEEAGIKYSWDSSVIITLLVLSGILWILFFFWQWKVRHEDSSQEAVLPWKFVHNRILMGIFL